MCFSFFIHLAERELNDTLFTALPRCVYCIVLCFMYCLQASLTLLYFPQPFCYPCRSILNVAVQLGSDTNLKHSSFSPKICSNLLQSIELWEGYTIIYIVWFKLIFAIFFFQTFFLFSLYVSTAFNPFKMSQCFPIHPISKEKKNHHK